MSLKPIRSAFTLLIFCCFAVSARAQEVKPIPCTSPEHRQFDFWIGDWDTFEYNDQKTVTAHNRVEKMLNGCALREVYEQNDGLVGESFSIYDSSRKVWHQSWVTNRGQLLIIEGSMIDGRMILTGSDNSRPDQPRLIRGIWQRVDGGVRETAEMSSDNGKSWQPLFDIVFRPRSGLRN